MASYIQSKPVAPAPRASGGRRSPFDAIAEAMGGHYRDRAQDAMGPYLQQLRQLYGADTPAVVVNPQFGMGGQTQNAQMNSTQAGPVVQNPQMGAGTDYLDLLKQLLRSV